MRRKLPWPFIVVIICSFFLGAMWGWKLLHDRAVEEGRLDAEGKLHVLAPPGLLSRELLLEFQREEKIEVEIQTETFPASLLRRALKSSPGQYDLALLYHHQVSALRIERRLAPLYDSRAKFPTTIAPDFRKLTGDRNLMDTAPLLWGFLGLAVPQDPKAVAAKPKLAFWPSFLIGLDDISIAPSTFAAKVQAQLGGLQDIEALMLEGPGGYRGPTTTPLIVSHGALAFSPLKEASLRFQALKNGDQDVYPLWILTATALADGDVERSRRFVRFLLEPRNNLALVQAARVGASTLREQEGLESLPEILQASYFRKFPINQILIERDERVRLADEVLEQAALGASIKVAKPTATPVVPSPKPVVPSPKPVVVAKPKPTSTPTPAPAVETPDEEVDVEEVPAATNGAESTTAPSESPPHDD